METSNWSNMSLNANLLGISATYLLWLLQQDGGGGGGSGEEEEQEAQPEDEQQPEPEEEDEDAEEEAQPEEGDGDPKDGDKGGEGEGEPEEAKPAEIDPEKADKLAKLREMRDRLKGPGKIEVRRAPVSDEEEESGTGSGILPPPEDTGPFDVYQEEYEYGVIISPETLAKRD